MFRRRPWLSHGWLGTMGHCSDHPPCIIRLTRLGSPSRHSRSARACWLLRAITILPIYRRLLCQINKIINNNQPGFIAINRVYFIIQSVRIWRLTSWWSSYLQNCMRCYYTLPVKTSQSTLCVIVLAIEDIFTHLELSGTDFQPFWLVGLGWCVIGLSWQVAKIYLKKHCT